MKFLLSLIFFCLINCPIISYSKDKYANDLIYTVMYKTTDDLKKILSKKQKQDLINIALSISIHFKKDLMTEVLLNHKAKIESFWDYNWNEISVPLTTKKVIQYENKLMEDENRVEGDIDSANPVYTLLDLNPKLFETALKNDRSWCNFKDYSQGKQDPEHLGPQWPIINHLKGKGFRKAQPEHLKIFYKYCTKK